MASIPSTKTTRAARTTTICVWASGMRRAGKLSMLKALFTLMVSLPLAAGVPSFKVIGTDAAVWTKIFDSIGIAPAQSADAAIVVAGAGAPADAARLAENHFLVVEGDCAAARELGIVPKTDVVAVRRVVDTHAPQLEVIWALPLLFRSSPYRQIFKSSRASIGNTRRSRPERRQRTAVCSGWRRVLEQKEQSVILTCCRRCTDLGLAPAVRTNELWAFFDSAYRSRADVDYLARRWRSTGIAALHVAAWHNVEPDAQRDEYLKKNLIEACHRERHSGLCMAGAAACERKLWAKHPQWREKTGVAAKTRSLTGASS